MNGKKLIIYSCLDCTYYEEEEGIISNTHWCHIRDYTLQISNLEHIPIECPLEDE